MLESSGTIDGLATGPYKAFYMYGFAKNERSNIDDDELKTFKAIARELLTHGDT